MIYILEGMHSGGKSTYAAKLQQETGYEIQRGHCRNLEEVKKLLEGKDNIIFDRLFIIPYMKQKRSAEASQDIIDYLVTKSDSIKCFILRCDADLAWQREQQKQRNYRERCTREQCDKVIEYTEQIINLRPSLWKVIDTTK